MAADPTGISSSDPGPQEAESDGMRMTAHSLPDQIARDRYLAAKTAGGMLGLGLRFRKMIGPPQCPAIPPTFTDGNDNGSFS